MKSLLLLRHGEAESHGGSGGDITRNLNDLGLAQAASVGRYLRQQGLTPEMVLSSTAARATQTASAVIDAAGWPVDLEQNATLYNATTESLLAVITSLPQTVKRLLIVAHAPGVPDLVNVLCGRDSGIDLNYSPATLSEIIGDITEWSELAPGDGILLRLRPGNSLAD